MKSKQLNAALAAGMMFALSLPHKMASIIARNAACISVLAIYYGAIVGLSANNANAGFMSYRRILVTERVRRQRLELAI
jgi:hypothetical protein